ncbi:MAG: glycerol dehydrogenase [Thermoplasmata archaeon]|nr:glycerol dehydrogenase [Thermoplasmata archaeon]
MDPIRRMTTPSLYLQGKGVVYYLGQKAAAYGNKAFVVGGETALSVAGDSVRKSLESNGIDVSLWDSTVKECTKGKIDELAEKGREVHPHFVVGVGGGKAVDTAKAVAWKLKIPSIIVGTQCATNADTSAESVIYTEDHKFMESIILPRNPVIVIEDTDILCKAPYKYLVWGMGDALSCKFESEAYAKARDRKKDGPMPTGAALALADACYKSLMEHGLNAVRHVRNGICSADVDEVIEAVKLSSAMAFENTGCALAHALHNGLTRTGTMKSQHGEIVAYCTIVQAAYEGRKKEEVAGLVSWCNSVDLPTRLSMLGDVDKTALKRAVDYACEKDHNAKNMPDKPKPSDVLRAIEELERGK